MADGSDSEQSAMSASNILVLPLHVTEEPTALPSSAVQLDPASLAGADEGLADLQPEPEEEVGERRGGWEGLMEEQKKLEYMACLGLVPPAVLEEIHRRQKMCRTEYGNWWDRLHSTDFCLVPKSESGLHSLHILNCESEGEGVMGDCGMVGGGGEDVTQIALRPDTGALVEQITYLTSWPQTTPPDTANSVEIITQPAAAHSIAQEVTTSSGAASFLSLREHYAGLLTESDQMSEDQLHAALQHITTTYR